MFTKINKYNITDIMACQRAIVIAPHPDDEVVGCGGILSFLEKKEIDFIFIFVTSGEQGLNVQLRTKEPYFREKEVPSALHELGFVNPQIQFLRFPDGKLALHKTEVSLEIQRYIHSYKPNVIFVPSFYEEHPDHSAVSEALSYCSEISNIIVSMYEVWSPLRPNCLFKINEFYSCKMNALDKYKSQEIFKIKEMSDALSAYRGCRKLGKNKRYYEAFDIKKGNDYINQTREFLKYVAKIEHT